MSILLPIINECNQNCLFCSAKGRNDKLEKNFFLKLIEQENESIIISGGEPTLSPDLFWVIKKAKEKNLFVELQTNATTLCYKNLAIKLLNLKVDLFNINFSAHNQQIDNKITQTKGLFDKKVSGIKNLQSLNATIRLTCIINFLNYKFLNNYVLFVKNNFPLVKYVQFSFIKIMGAVDSNSSIVISYDKVQPYLLEALDNCLKLNIEYIIDHIPLCYLGKHKENHIDTKKVYQGESPEYSEKEKTKIKECANCTLASICYGVRKDYLKFFNKKVKVKPIKPSK